ncbi:MAG: dynamin family protein, partial [bacterium]|nr:dynamin family protein [bacterium]
MQLMNLHKGISFLQDENLKGQLQSIEKQLSDKTFNLPLIGQFSAGKSMLINNLLGAEVLPVKVTETTAFITYITYGETPKAMIRYKDEVQEEVSIDYIKSLHQIQVENEGHKLRQIRDIHVQYPSPFLEKGLCLIDTPGVNTLFAEHEALTKALLEDTYYMVYVMAKPLTQFDIQFIKSIIQTGVQPIFVRTGIDNIKSSEESVEQAVAKEKLMLQAQLNQEVYFYPITNKYQELGNMDFTMKFDMLRKFLQDEIIANRDKVKEEALKNKLAYLTSCIKEKLIQKQEQLKILNLSDEQTLTKAIEVIENQIYKLELESTVLERECTNKFTKAFDKLKNEMASLKGEI